jgi:transmembrane sensor
MKKGFLMSRPPPQSEDVEEAAALWYARMTSELRTPADESRFEAWLAESEVHAEVYNELCALSGGLDAIRSHPRLAAYRVEAQLIEERQRGPFSSRIAWASAACALIVVLTAVIFLSLRPAPLVADVWATARGETRQIALSDGSKFVLGSNSRVEIRFQRERRDVQLTQGQAFFEVAPDAHRPFVVQVGERTVTALGTKFDVRSFSEETIVTLVHGRISIDGQRHAHPTILDPGQQFYADRTKTEVRKVDAILETSWRQGILEFKDVTLAEAVTEFSRNSKQTITLGDAKLSTLRVSGVFHANDASGFARALIPAYPVTATFHDSGDIVLNLRNEDGATP